MQRVQAINAAQGALVGPYCYCLLYKRLHQAAFIVPSATDGKRHFWVVAAPERHVL